MLPITSYYSAFFVVLLFHLTLRIYTRAGRFSQLHTRELTSSGAPRFKSERLNKIGPAEFIRPSRSSHNCRENRFGDSLRVRAFYANPQLNPGAYQLPIINDRAAKAGGILNCNSANADRKQRIRTESPRESPGILSPLAPILYRYVRFHAQLNAILFSLLAAAKTNMARQAISRLRIISFAVKITSLTPDLP